MAYHEQIQSVAMEDISWSKLVWELYKPIPAYTRFKYTARIAACPLTPIISAIGPGAKTLDFGCGIGLIMNTLVAMGRVTQAVGCDLRQADIEFAVQALNQLRTNTPNVSQDIEYRHIHDMTEIPQGPFDVVLLIDVMHHVQKSQKRACFNAAAARVRPGGRLIYKDMCDRPLWRAWANKASDFLSTGDIVSYVPIEHVDAWGIDCGLKNVHRHDFSKFVYGHEMIVFERE